MKNFGYYRRFFWELWAFSFDKENQQIVLHDYNIFCNQYIFQRKDKVIEIGCGFGRNLKYLSDLGYPAHLITGIDISGKMINKAVKNLSNDKITLIRSDICGNTQFSNKEFDTSYVSLVLMHIPEEKLANALNEIIRITKKRIIIQEQSRLRFNSAHTVKSAHHESSYFTFEHDYPYYLDQLGFSYTLLKQFGNIFVYEVVLSEL